MCSINQLKSKLKAAEMDLTIFNCFICYTPTGKVTIQPQRDGELVVRTLRSEYERLKLQVR